MVRDPASRPWSPAGCREPVARAGAMSAAVRKDLALNLSAVHENLRGRASKTNLETSLESRHRDLSVRCVFFGGTASPHPFIVRDESSRVFLGGALQQSPPLRRHHQWWCSFRLRSTGKDKPASRLARCCRRQNRQQCGCFIPPLTVAEGFSLKEIGDHLGHRSAEATRIYAKVDLVGLREVADFDLGGLR